MNSSQPAVKRSVMPGYGWLAVGAALLGVISRIPFRSVVLHHWDSVNFALALTRFDVRLHQPHPPGTFVLYIFLGRLFDMVFQDANSSLVWVSILATGLGIAALVGLAGAMFDRRTAFLTGLFALTSPMVWFHGEVALSYMLEFLWVPLIVYACFRLKDHSWKALLVSALLMGMAGGIRPNTPVFLFPLWVMGVWINKYPLKKILVAFLLMGLGVLIWMVPMITMSGGLMEYISIMIWWQNQHTETSGSLSGMIENLVRFGMYSLYTLGVGIFPIVIIGLPRMRSIMKQLLSDWRAQVMAAWVLPGAFYFAIIHLRQPGHIFTIVPAFFILAALAVQAIPVKADWLKWTLVGGIVVLNAVFFLAGPTYLFGDQRMLFTTPSRNTIEDYDRYVNERLESIEQRFDPATTAVLANGRNFRLPAYYLQDYQVPLLSSDIQSNPVTLPAGVRTLVFFDEDFLLALPAELHYESIALPSSGELKYVTWGSGMTVTVTTEQIEIR